MEKENGEANFHGEKIHTDESGYSEKKIDIMVDRGKSNKSNVKNQTSAKKKKNGLIYANERLK